MKKHSSIKEDASELSPITYSEEKVTEKIIYKEKDSEVENRIKELDLNTITPLEALNILNELKGKIL